MHAFPVNLSRGLGVLLGALATTMAQGQPITVVKPAQAKTRPVQTTSDEHRSSGAVHRIELYSGPHHSIAYMPSDNVSNNDRVTAREMERAENEQIYVRDLERLKQQYVNSERVSEPQRRAVQKDLYGKSITTNESAADYSSRRFNTGYGGIGSYPGYLGYNAYPGYLGYGGYGGFGGYAGYGNRRGFSNGYAGSASESMTRSLQFGVGDEGRFKDEMVKVIAQQASPEYADAAQRHYHTALSHAAASPAVARAMSPHTTANVSADEDELSYPKDSEVVVWSGNEKYSGTVKADRPNWLIL